MDEKNMHNLFLKVSWKSTNKISNRSRKEKKNQQGIKHIFLQNMAGLIEETKNPSPCLNPWVQQRLKF